MTRIRCEACILAGGLSSRMGREKASLRLGTKSLLAHARFAARQAGFPVRVIRRDLVPHCGPLGGVVTALQTTKAEAVLLLSCDMPFVTGALLKRMLARLAPHTKAVFLVHEKLGLPCVIRRAALERVEQMLAAKRFSLRELAAHLKAESYQLPASQASAAFNINTPEDLLAARILWRRRHAQASRCTSTL